MECRWALRPPLLKKGTTSAQKVIAGTLATLPELAGKAGLESPSLIIVGQVWRLTRGCSGLKARWQALDLEVRSDKRIWLQKPA